MKRYFPLALAFASAFLQAAPSYNDPMKPYRDALEDLRRLVNNQELEIRTFEEKVASQETILDSIRSELKEQSQGHKDLLKNQSGTLEMKIGSLETSNKGLVADLKQMKNGFNEVGDTLKAYKDKIHQLEKMVELQNKNIENLQAALNSVMDAFKATSGISTDGSTKTYRVKAGDSLEKIARQNNMSVKALKELNGLSKDQIIVGQTLKVAE